MQETIYQFTEDYPEVILSVARYSHEDLFNLISNNEIDLVLSYQRRAFLEAYENFHLRYIPCLGEVSGRSRLAQEEAIYTKQLKDLPCILVAKKAQQELEQSFYQHILGIGNNFYFVESMDDARLAVIDCCKIVSAQAKLEQDIWEMEFSQHKYPTAYIPLIAVVTASGTGAEQNCGAVIIHEEKKIKAGVLGAYAAFLNPVYTLSLPMTQVMSGAFDTLSHSMETYFGSPEENNLSMTSARL